VAAYGRHLERRALPLEAALPLVDVDCAAPRAGRAVAEEPGDGLGEGGLLRHHEHGEAHSVCLWAGTQQARRCGAGACAAKMDQLPLEVCW